MDGLNNMFGPPCYSCGSEFNWYLGKDGEKCRCGWPENKKSEMDKTDKKFSNTELGQNLGYAAILMGITCIIFAIKGLILTLIS